MRRLLCVVIGILLVAATASAQTKLAVPVSPETKISWDHDGANTDRFELRVDDGPYTDLGKPVGNVVPFPAMTPGDHVLLICAANFAGRACAPPFPVSLVVVPTAPSAVRIVTQE